MLHWTTGADKDGMLLPDDTLQVVTHLCRITFPWSYPNMIPLSAGTVMRIADVLRRRRVERAHGFSVGRQITQRGSAVIEHSARRYIKLLAEDR